MEYRRFGNTIVARIDRGEEILAAIREIARTEHIQLASVSALGATNDFTVGVYNVDEKQYHANDFKGNFEIVSLTGTINTMDGEFLPFTFTLSAGIAYTFSSNDVSV